MFLHIHVLCKNTQKRVHPFLSRDFSALSPLGAPFCCPFRSEASSPNALDTGTVAPGMLLTYRQAVRVCVGSLRAGRAVS